MAWLSRNRVLCSDLTQTCYRVATHRLAQGGYGEVFGGLELDEHRDPCRQVAINIRDAVSKGADRFGDAAEALRSLLAQPVKPTRAPRTLRDQRVVCTGKLAIPRLQTQEGARRCGAHIQGRVGPTTTLIVAGQPNPPQIGQKAGTKLFGAHCRLRRGQSISIVDARQFDRLLARGGA